MNYLKLDDFKNYSFLSRIEYSPDGAKRTLIQKRANAENGYYSVIYVDKGDGFKPLTNVKGNVGTYFWQDNENIVFTDKRNEASVAENPYGLAKTSYYKINVQGGEAAEAFVIEANVKEILPLEEGKYIVLATFDNNKPCLLGKDKYEKEKILEEYAKEKDYQVIDELPYWADGGTFTNKLRSRLYIFSEKDGLKPLTPPLAKVDKFKLSPCKKHIIFSGDVEYFGVAPLKDFIYNLCLETGEIKQILSERMHIRAFEFLPGKPKMIMAASYGTNYSIGENHNFYILDLQDGSLSLFKEYDRSICSAVGTDSSLGSGRTFAVEGDSCYFTSLDGYYADIYKLCLNTGTLENVTCAKGSVEMFDVYNGGLAAIAMLDGKLEEVYSFKDGDRKKLTGFNDEIYNSTKHPVIEHFVITDSEGVEFDGFVALPVDYDKNEKYPAILNIHGGPRAVYGDVYFHEMQYWANQNYFVLFSNPRGSDGKGNEFADVRGKYGLIDYDNIMLFLDTCIEKYPAIDSEKLGVTGGSYGGYMTNWIIGHNNRFKAAASQRSICNWFSYMIGDLGYFFTDYDILANPWDNPEKLWFHSPLKYADKAKTPTLLIHSDMDYRCSIPEAYQMFTALKLHGVDTRLCVFHGESHGLSRIGKPEHRVRRLEEITCWMDKYLKISK